MEHFVRRDSESCVFDVEKYRYSSTVFEKIAFSE